MTVSKMKKKESKTRGAANQNYLDENAPSSVDEVIDRYKRQLSEKESARLPNERDVLLTMYDRLQQRKIRREQRAFYLRATEDEIADRVMELTEDEIIRDRGK